MRRTRRPVKGLAVGGICLAAAGIIIWKLPPDQWWLEILVIGLVFGGLFISVAWLTKSRRWGIKISGWLVVLLLLRRWGIMDIIGFGIWLFLLGLLCLFN